MANEADTEAAGEGCGEVDLHRVDLAARLLALKLPTPDPEGLIERAAAQLAGRGSGPRGCAASVIVLIPALIRASAEGSPAEAVGREQAAALRLGALLAAPLDPADLSALRSLLRRGEFERPLSLAAQRRIRRVCRGPMPVGVMATELEGLAAGPWEALLELLARSLVVESEAEIRVDALLEDGDEGSLHRRRAGVREALERGAVNPATAPLRSGSAEPRSDETMATTELQVPVERELMPAGHKIGRFTLLTRLGVGAMGVVYSAYDPELDRRIAVKLLRAPEGRHAARAQARLLREAQAMARLNHPNVVVVHDVGTHERDVFVAMEFIRGHTLQAWRLLRPRKWSEIVDLYVQAGRGLAAAHAVGLVHRDFKASNAMVGDDGRVRVLDFGLCHAELSGDSLADASSPESASTGRLGVSLGEGIVGTPAYMAPEQFHGRAAVAASDQFSFCASLYEALYEQLPFAGETVHQLAYSVSRGELRPPPRGTRVPVWLHAAIVRGMRRDPRSRFASMEALLRALERKRARVRTGALAAALGVVLAGGAGFLTASQRGSEVDPCSGGKAAVREVWNETRGRAAEQAFASAGPGLVAEVWPRARQELDRYADEWQRSHRATCEAHRRGEASSEMLDRAMACLGQRKAALGEAVRVLTEADGAVALRALAVVGDLPGLARCGDVAALQSDAPAPSDPQVHAAVEDQRLKLRRVSSLERGGRVGEAVKLADEVLKVAERLGERALVAESLLQRVALEIHGEATKAQDERLTRAYLTALGGGLDERVVEALALRMYLRGRKEGDQARALEDLAVARETLTRVPSPGWLGGLVLNNAGTVHLALGDIPRAERMFREALAAREAALGQEHIDVAYTLVNLAMISAREDERIGMMERALRIFDVALGAAHPQTIEVRIAASLHARDPVAARALLQPGCDALARLTPDDHAGRVRCLGNLAHHAGEAGDEASATQLFREVADLLQRGDPAGMGEDDVLLLRARAGLATGLHAPAIEQVQAALKVPPAEGDLWKLRHHAELGLVLAQHLQRLGRVNEAREALKAAVGGYEAVSVAARDMLLEQRLALARLLLGTLLLREPGGVSGAVGRPLLAAAEQWYRGAGPGYAWRLVEVAAAHVPPSGP